MEEHKHLYDDTIRATFQIAIREAADRLNQAADGFNQAARLEFKQDEGYEKARTKSGALLNNNYAL